MLNLTIVQHDGDLTFSLCCVSRAKTASKLLFATNMHHICLKLFKLNQAALTAGLLAACWPVLAAEVRVAVAANFAVPFQELANNFAAETAHQAIMSAGSTGKFYTQIRSGAPFDVLLAADQATPRQLETQGFAVKGQHFTYAKGQLVLWSSQTAMVDQQGKVLSEGVFKHLAIANPKLAPYGAAALQVLTALKLQQKLAPKLVQGESITQTMQFVASGNAALGFVALSQVLRPNQPPLGSWWLVPNHLYDPILQEAALLKPGHGNAAALALMHYLQSDKARAIIQSYGYGL